MADALEPFKGFLNRVRGAMRRRRLATQGTGLCVVHDPENAEIDIVAIHGLGGHSFSHWVSDDPAVRGKPRPWLEELLAVDMPKARIMTYGYISDGINYRYVVRNIVYGRALDLARSLAYRRNKDGCAHSRPLFFIAHSLGGWIVKRALIISGEAADPELRDLELSTCGVAFFGTVSPGRPSSPEPLARVFRRTTTGSCDDWSPSSRRSGSADNDANMQPEDSELEWLTSQMEAFKAISPDLPRLSFYETKKSEDEFIVEKRHSIAGLDGSQIGLKATHQDLVRFKGRDENYKTFIDNFRQMVDDARSSELMQSKRKIYDMSTVTGLEYISDNFTVPYTLPDTGAVVPREELLNRLDGILNPDTNSPTLNLSIVTLWGLPGTGKSTLARHYAELNKDKLSFVFWIRSESWETVMASYLEIANTLVEHYSNSAEREQVESDLGLIGVQDMLKAKTLIELDTPRTHSVVRAIRNWLLRPGNRSWLLVFDNVESSFDIFEFIPLTLAGKIIFTSRDSNCCSWGTKLQVDAMTEQESIDLLASVMGKAAVEDPAQREAAARVVKQLEYHPQNISLAASTMRNKALSLLEYHKRIESKLPLSIFGSTMDQSPVTHTVLRVSAMLSDSAIPVALFTVSSLKTVPARFANVFAEMKAFQDDHLDAALQYLLDHDFIQTPSSSSSESTDSNSASSPSTQSSISFDSFVMDSAARDHVRDSLTPEEKFDNAWLACNVCADGIEKNESASSTLQEIHEFARVMAPHAKTCYSDWSRVLEGPDDDVDGNEDVAWHILGRVCMTQGATEQAIGCFELSLQHASRLSAMERTQTALLLAILLQNNGQKQRSNEMLASIDLNLESIDKALGFRVALERAAFAAAQGEFDYAGDQYQSLEYLQEEELGASDMTTLGTAEALAATLARLRNYDVAMPLYRRVHLSYQKALGESHPMTLHALESLARVCKDAFDIDGAEEMYAQSIEIKTRTLGAGHPGIANPLMCLGIIDDLRKRFSSARDRYQRALAIVAPSLGRAHPLYVATMENLALSRRLEAHDLPPPPPSPHVSHRRRRTFMHKRDGNDSSPSRSSLAPSADPSLLRLANDDDDDDGTSTTTRATPAPAADASEGRISPRALAFNDAERLYFETIRIKQSARELYTQRDVFSTAAKLAEMYEHEEFYDADRRQRNGVLKDMLRESAGQRDMKKCVPMAVP
ncbi:tetratricopeptide repeat protein [Purpureocillium lilacinum]|uniref:Tetratricopeptide repeat protein n=1 Tax=Purpureocillium lilacinum TaxID=33203 RepID=A0A179GKN2_PURLI|nr:tetratricopeptide repeat protein [Purpureocillium lilacinum]